MKKKVFSLVLGTVTILIVVLIVEVLKIESTFPQNFSKWEALFDIFQIIEIFSIVVVGIYSLRVVKEVKLYKNQKRLDLIIDAFSENVIPCFKNLIIAWHSERLDDEIEKKIKNFHENFDKIQSILLLYSTGNAFKLFEYYMKITSKMIHESDDKGEAVLHKVMLKTSYLSVMFGIIKEEITETRVPYNYLIALYFRETDDKKFNELTELAKELAISANVVKKIDLKRDWVC